MTKSAATEAQLGLTLVEVDTAAAVPPPPREPEAQLMDRPPPPTDMIGPGDVLNVAIYEAGVTLFSNAPGAAGAAMAGGGMDTGARAQTLPELRVDDNGDITLPYAGKLRVLGETPAEIEQQIRLALRGYSQNPQVLVTRRSVITNSVMVGGEVAKPGRLVLDTNRESLSDVVAMAGGYRGKASDIVMRIKRRDETANYRLSTLLEDPAIDVRAYPGDRLTLIYDPMSFSVLGAAGRMEQIPFATASMTLAQAISAAGGPNPNLGDPAAIFVFRYVDDPANAGQRKPMVYHINMMRTGSYFLAQNFWMQNKDVLYFGNARANQPSKVIQLISQLFSPVVAVTSAVSVVKN
ncbi:polysaccharide biosynthesis/export family protein [Novosphingobium sp. SG916]|uniref:polysaccharide biosynthesis/export family protein n=1 Tax=unclassified Novosphingobium TaxID=2644732 RepID=UPI001826F27B|nr:polysaccharide export outer membrane protein [Novosphingobium sp. SG919]NMN86811.1 polysaccharide export outer membrane protein [Novosphingobium sp. SG916]